jgi:hypothetical protein
MGLSPVANLLLILEAVAFLIGALTGFGLGVLLRIAAAGARLPAPGRFANCAHFGRRADGDLAGARLHFHRLDRI